MVTGSLSSMATCSRLSSAGTFLSVRLDMRSCKRENPNPILKGPGTVPGRLGSGGGATGVGSGGAVTASLTGWSGLVGLCSESVGAELALGLKQTNRQMNE
jgi:hypothetical protein